ncbi:MAG: hypothetical protein E7513_05135 [Ruminococcaceae bacterium]|nr:hypothetical protein [Oscillospiraceae bacterium]
MKQTLVIKKTFYDKLSRVNNLAVLKNKGYNTADEFISAIINKLNSEFGYLEIEDFRFTNNEEDSLYSQYGAFVSGENLPYKKVVVFFTPIVAKLGNVIIEQSLMPTICNQMEKNVAFLFDDSYKKILVMTSQINQNNQVEVGYNKLQMDINSLNTLNFDVIQLFKIKNLSTDTKFNSLVEYLDMSDYLQKLGRANAQYKYLEIKDNVLYGDCEPRQLQGEFHKSFCFRFLTAMFAGGDDFKYSIDKITTRMDRLDNQFSNLSKFIEYINNTAAFQNKRGTDDNTIESDDEIVDIEDIHRKPVRGIDSKGRKRYKTQKKIRDSVIKEAKFLCDCNDNKHYYFESINLHNYVEGHHVVPMNRQDEYYFDHSVNLDVPYNIIPLCPNCHSQIHLGSREARIKILSEIYVRNRNKLSKINPELSLVVLASYYNIGLDEEEEIKWLRYAENAVEKRKNCDLV